MTRSGPGSHTAPRSPGWSASGPAPEMEQHRSELEAPSTVEVNLVAVHSQTFPTMSTRPHSLAGCRPPPPSPPHVTDPPLVGGIPPPRGGPGPAVRAHPFGREMAGPDVGPRAASR